MTQPSDEMVERVARQVYAGWPMRAVSRALAELTGVPIGTDLSWDQVLESGGNHDSLLHICRAAIAATEQAIVEWLRADNGPVPGYMMDLHDTGDIADAIERGEHRKGK